MIKPIVYREDRIDKCGADARVKVRTCRRSTDRRSRGERGGRTRRNLLLFIPGGSRRERGRRSRAPTKLGGRRREGIALCRRAEHIAGKWVRRIGRPRVNATLSRVLVVPFLLPRWERTVASIQEIHAVQIIRVTSTLPLVHWRNGIRTAAAPPELQIVAGAAPGPSLSLRRENLAHLSAQFIHSPTLKTKPTERRRTSKSKSHGV